MIAEAREYITKYLQWLIGQREDAPRVLAPVADIQTGWGELLAAITTAPLAFAPRDYLICLGFDPGWAKTGIGAVVQHAGRSPASAGVELILTAPDHSLKHLRQSFDDNRRLEIYYRAACAAIEKIRPDAIGVECYTIYESDDYEKLRTAAENFVAFLGMKRGASPSFASPSELLAAFASGELFRQFLALLGALSKAVDAFRQQRGRGAAAKTYGVYTAVCCAAYHYGIPVFIFMPADLKKEACGKAKASKEEVAVALSARITGLKEAVERKVRQAKLQEHPFDASGMALLALQQITKMKGSGSI